MIVVSTSNKIVVLESVRSQPKDVLLQDKGFYFLRTAGQGFFGIDYCQTRKKIFVAERHHFRSTSKLKYPSTDVRLYEIDVKSCQVKPYGWLKDVHHVHQIVVYQQWLFLSDTGKNRIVVYDLNQKRISRHINLGHQRKDVHHINALSIQGTYLMVNCNNMGRGVSELVQIPLSWIEQSDGDVVVDNRDFFIDGFYDVEHTHDLEMQEGGIYYCASKMGQVFKQGQAKPIIQVDRWTRGIAFTDKYLLLGLSQMVGAEDRHSALIDGAVAVYNLKNMEKECEVVIPGAGQVNDIIVID